MTKIYEDLDSINLDTPEFKMLRCDVQKLYEVLHELKEYSDEQSTIIHS